MREFSVYAPVLLPTLCRYEHFRRCVESLARCTYADKTELVIGLDYPIKEEHWYGYNKISDYVNTITGFSKVTIFRRERNYGFGPNGNLSHLKKYANQKYDRYILTEDDNEFSPCFLDFMNKALDFYRHDDKVRTICGFNQYRLSNKNIIFVYDTSAWGMGCWFEKKRPVTEDTKALLESFVNVVKLLRVYPRHLSSVINMIRLGKNWGDANCTCNNIINDQYQLRPSLSLVRNWGHDGTGEHGGNTDVFERMEISDALTFDFPFVKAERTCELDSSIRHNRMPQKILSYIIVYSKIGYKALKYYFSNKL